MTKVGFELRSGSWWKAAGIRALRTALAVLLPFLGAEILTEVNWAVAGSTVALAVILSFLTSLVGLKELEGGGVSKTLALIVRGIKTFAQTAISYVGSAVLLTEVDWQNLLLISASATVVTILNGVLTGLPEEETTNVPLASGR